VVPRRLPAVRGHGGCPGLADVLWFLPDQGGPVTSLVALVLTVPGTAATVTRLHDRAHSACWLLRGLVPPLGLVVLFATVGLLDSQPYPNRHGPPPR
jgi:uncharacterized membrane protein YhaH (DUF805 family)